MSEPLHGTKGKLWAQASEFDEVWKNRIFAMARHIDVPGPVADFGCGMMWLEQFLKPENTYFPIDYLRRDERTLVLDLNQDNLTGVKAQVAFLSGVLEYVRDVRGFAKKLADAGFAQVILSYCTLEKHPNLEARRKLNWVSHESLFTLLAYFLEDYSLTNIDDVKANTILVFARKSR